MASMDFGDAFDQLANDDFWIDVGAVFAGFMAPNILAGAVEGVGPDLPNELYGIAVAGVSEMAFDSTMGAVGGGLYTTDVLAQRLGIRQRVTELGGS